jgi:membrane protein
VATKLVLLLGETYRKFQQDNVMRAAASISYFTLLTIVPLLLLAIVVGSAFLETDDIEPQLIELTSELAGPQAAEFVGRFVDSLGAAAASTNTTILTVILALWAASLAFAHLRSMLNTMWEVDSSEVDGVRGYVVRRAIGIAFVLVMGMALVLTVFVFRLAASVFAVLLHSEAIEGEVSILLSDLTGFAVLFVVFFAVYRILPHKRLPYPDLVVGAAVTTVLFLLGEWVLSVYFENSSRTTIYGAAGTTIALLLWLYYSSTIVLTSAEFTYVWSQRDRVLADAGDLTLKEAVMRQLPDRRASRSET